MKKIILYIDTLYRCGAQRVMSNLASYFSQRYEVLLVNDFIADDSKSSYYIPKQIRRVYLRDKLEGNPVLKNIVRVSALRKLIKKEKPDVVLSFLGKPNKRMLIATIGLKCKKVVSVRNLPSHEYGSSAIQHWIAKCMFFMADAVVFQTEEAANYFQPSVIKKSTIIYNPVGKQFYETERKTDKRDVITVGRFEAQKNHRLLIDAWAKIEKEFPQDRLIIYGEGPLRVEYEQQIRNYGLTNRVLLPGVISDVSNRLAGAKLFVLSSDFEGMPNALMEAMAVGVPCVSTDCPSGGPKALMRDNIDGMLVPCNDIDSLAVAMKKLLMADNCESYGESARNRALIFREDVVYKQWDEFLFYGL